MPAQRLSPFRGRDPRSKVEGPRPRLWEKTLERLLSLDQLQHMYDELPPAAGPDEFLSLVLAKLKLSYDVTGALNDIPRTGRLIVVANHPFGAIEGLILAQVLGRIRSDVKVLANYLLTGISELRDIFIPVDPFGGPRASGRNIGPLRTARDWLQQDGCLILFPAGTVSHLHWRRREVTDPAWNHGAAWLATSTRSPVLPVYFHGANSLTFQVVGLVQPRLRTALLPRELLRRQNSRVALIAGETISAQRVAAFDNEAQLTKYLRLHTYLLGEKHGAIVGSVRRHNPPRTIKPAIPPVPRDTLAREVAALPRAQHFIQDGACDVYAAKAAQIPALLQEIGRLREITFREVGEGTGHGCDIDLFDEYYEHLFVWHRERSEVVGAYRLARSDSVSHARTGKGLYTYSLFKYSTSFLNSLGPALELGRSFVRREYQRSHSALLLLWKGIFKYVSRNPDYATLFGPVSISSNYGYLSRQLLVEFLAARHMDGRLARDVRGRQPFRSRPFDHELMHGVSALGDVNELSRIITALEPDAKGVPVLLRHYLKLGGRLVAFNVDSRFNHCVDGLIVVDLRTTDPTALRRFMGCEGLDVFLRHHARKREAWRLAS